MGMLGMCLTGSVAAAPGTDVVVLAIVLYAVLGKLADLAARGLERVWLRWHWPSHLHAPLPRRPLVLCLPRRSSGRR